MKQDKLVDAIGMIKDEYIEEAHSPKRKSFSWLWPKRIAIGLACVLLCVSVIPNVFKMGGYASKSDSYEPSEGIYNGGNYDDVAENEIGQLPLQENKKLILTANLELETMNLDDTVSALNSSIVTAGGYVQSSSNYSTGNRRFYKATIRIPADKYDDFINTVKGSGNAVSYSEHIDDVTEAYTDLEARLASLKAEEERVLEFYKEAKDLEELMLVEERLTKIRYEIESKQAQLKNYDLLTSYSTLNITISETKEYTPVQQSFGKRLVESFKNGFTNFIDFIEDFVIDIAYNIWGILLLALIVFVIYKVVKHFRNRKNK